MHIGEHCCKVFEDLVLLKVFAFTRWRSDKAAQENPAVRKLMDRGGRQRCWSKCSAMNSVMNKVLTWRNKFGGKKKKA